METKARYKQPYYMEKISSITCISGLFHRE